MRQQDRKILRAIENLDLQLIQSALQEGADINARTDIGNTPLLFFASIWNHRMSSMTQDKIRMAKFLIQSGANINAQDDSGNTALILAAEPFFEDKDDLASLLIDSGADLNLRNGKGFTALIHACKSGKKDIFNKLLDAGADVNIGDAMGVTPLMYMATDHGHRNFFTDEVKHIISCGADVNVCDANGKTALMRWSGDVNDINEYNLLCERDTTDTSDVLNIILEAGADIHARDNTGNTVLSRALSYGVVDVSVLYKYGADAHTRDNDGNTSLMKIFSPSNGKRVISTEKELNDLLSRGVPADAIDKEGKNVLHYTLEWHCKPKMLERLIQTGAPINASTLSGETPFITYCRSGISDRDFLYSFVEPIFHIGSEYGESVRGHDGEILSVLLNNGADVNAQTRKGETGASLCLRNRNPLLFSKILSISDFTGAAREKIIETILSEQINFSREHHRGVMGIIAAASMYPERDSRLENMMSATMSASFRALISITGLPERLDFGNVLAVMVNVKKTPMAINLKTEEAKRLIPLLLNQMEKSPDKVIQFIRKRAKKSLEVWSNDGVEGADILVSRLVPHLRHEELMNEGSGTQNMDFF